MDPPPSPSKTQIQPPLSKNQLRKLKRDQEWENNRAKRKDKRKEKHREKKQQKKAAREQTEPVIPSIPELNRTTGIEGLKKSQRHQFLQLPITIVLDCGFDHLMNEKELKSLGSQVTRCYSDNHKAPYQVHLAVSSFGGNLKDRFEGLLAGNHRSWKNVTFGEQDFVEIAAQANEWMKGDRSGNLAGAFTKYASPENASIDLSDQGEVIYLTSDSPDTLTELRPYSTYIIGGLVDRNRHKGVCYKKAKDRDVKTAKLPISEYMQMNSRFVLATNHVVEIIVRWLELGDWGKAFLQAIPKRKGGMLKDAPQLEEDSTATGKMHKSKEAASDEQGVAVKDEGKRDDDDDDDEQMDMMLKSLEPPNSRHRVEEKKDEPASEEITYATEKSEQSNTHE